MSVTLSIISTFSFAGEFSCSSAEEVSCSQWMWVSTFGRYQTDLDIIESCDDETFEALDHEYAKDKNFVYFKPMPNANNMVVILEAADSETFKLLRRCKRYADKNHVFSGINIVEDKDPNILNQKFNMNDPKTYCY